MTPPLTWLPTEIEQCYTDPAFINRGAGKAAVRSVVRAADAMGNILPVLVVPKAEAVGFWEKIGFQSLFGKNSDGSPIGLLLRRV